MQTLVTEIFKVKYNTSPELLHELFLSTEKHYDLKVKSTLK